MYYRARTYKDSWGFGRTDTYRGTTTNPKVDGEVIALKEQVKMNNKVRTKNAERAVQFQADNGSNEDELMEVIDRLFDWHSISLKRVRFMGRGPRRDELGNRPYWNIDSYLRHEDSTHFDVYLHDDDTQMERVRERLRRKYCPETMKVKDLEWELLQAKWDLQRKLRND